MKKSDTDKPAVMGSHAEDNFTDSALETMGITNPSEIIRYTLRQEDNQDVLRVYYRRNKGSFLPTSKKIKFGRTHKTIITDSGTPEYAEQNEISPFLQDAVTQLDEIVKHSKDATELKQEILDELNHIEKYVSSRIKHLRSQVEDL
jgi:outer membrane protein OmpA-like peptidoglycan-associated protein